LQAEINQGTHDSQVILDLNVIESEENDKVFSKEFHLKVQHRLQKKYEEMR
jgi:hypothetical protein